MRLGIINVLDAQTANLIAAGEVVERPSSAAKELLENSIDANSKSITLEIKSGGRSYLRVTDDGNGFLREDIPKALLRHATSKIECGDDISGIRSLGFRGEALAAISSVSRLEIISKSRLEEIGTRLTADEDGIVMEDVGCPDGTTVVMRDIFYNTPARQKFLKRDGTESASCVSAAERLALSHPEISFTVISDGERKFTTAGDGKVFPAIYSVFGREFANSLIEIEYELSGVRVRGFITRPDSARGSRSMQTMFVNGRYVKSKTVQAALEEAFRSFIPRGKYPGCVIFVSLDPEQTDVNVHPAKTEIKFASERDVFRAVYYAAKSALESEPEPEEILIPTEKEIVSSPTLAVPQKMPETLVTERLIPPVEEKKSEARTFRADIGLDDMLAPPAELVLSDSKSARVEETALEEPKIVSSSTCGQVTIAPEKPLWRMIGQAYDSYIFVETEENILIIDKHAAHERILYEKLAKTKELHVQELLSGVPISVGRAQAAILLENAAYLEEKGFTVEDFGEGSILVRTVPMSLSNLKGLSSIIEDFAKSLSDGNGLSFSERCDRALYTVACKAALKAGVKNRPEDDENVVKMLSENPNLRYCPHGRPFIKKLEKREIEKYFDR